MQGQRLYFTVGQDCWLHSCPSMAVGWALQLHRFSGMASWFGETGGYTEQLGMASHLLPACVGL